MGHCCEGWLVLRLVRRRRCPSRSPGRALLTLAPKFLH